MKFYSWNDDGIKYKYLRVLISTYPILCTVLVSAWCAPATIECMQPVGHIGWQSCLISPKTGIYRTRKLSLLLK